MARKKRIIVDKTNDEDLRHDDREFDPTLEPKKGKAWLNLLRESEEAFEKWNTHCDNIDKLYANLERLSQHTRDKEFQMFWANNEVLKPSIYAKPPKPVVVPKFKDKRPVYQAASELMERCCIVSFDLARINDLMLLVRDDVSMLNRGVAWCRYESGKGKGYYSHEKVCIDFKHRRDFLHSVARNWTEVTWVAGASYLTRKEARERIYDKSKDAYQQAEYKVDKEAKNVGGADNRQRAKFWEIWDKNAQRVVWVAEGVEDILDEDDPHLELQNFFPCPKPAYGTLQRNSLVPVPDVLQYKDQLDEINLLTGRIHALSDALEVKGFYPAGGAELADAIQTAVSIKTPGRLLVPISNWAAFGGTKDVIIWLPIDIIAQTIIGLVQLRKQVIEDIYQIMGLSDIMRGSTDPNETLGAQQLKTQNGSTRLRDKQQELVRLARDLVEITSDIITEKFDPETMIEMSQTQLPTMAMQKKEAQGLLQQYNQVQQAMQAMQQRQLPAPQQGMQGPPGAPPPGGAPPQPPGPDQQQQQMLQQGEQALAHIEDQLNKLREKPTLEQVLHFLDDNRAKSFVLDIETDSTIMADEQAEKQQRTEFVGVLGQLLPQLSAMITAEPKTADFCGELLKFATAPFRAGRALDGAIDELIEQMKTKGEAGKGVDPTTAANQVMLQVEQMKQQTERDKIAADAEQKRLDREQKDKHKQWELQNDRAIVQAQNNIKVQDAQGKVQLANQKAMHDREEHQASMIERQQDMALNNQKMQVQREALGQKQQLAQQTMRMKQNDLANRTSERQMALRMKAQQPTRTQ